MKKMILLIVLLMGSLLLATRPLTTYEDTIIAVGPLLSPTDGYTPVTGATVTLLTVEIYVENDAGTVPTRFANFVPTASGGTNDMALITSSVSGVYSLELTQAQLNFTGWCRITVVDTDSAGAEVMPWFKDYYVTSANKVDSEYGTDELSVETVSFNSDTNDTLTLKNIVVNNSAGVGIAVTGSTKGISVTGTTEQGMLISGLSYGLSVAGTTSGALISGGSAYGLNISGVTNGILTTATGGYGINAQGSTSGIYALGTTNGHGFMARGAGTGGDFYLYNANSPVYLEDLVANWESGGSLYTILNKKPNIR